MVILLLGACRSGTHPATDEATPAEALVYEINGLPDCGLSLTDEQICAGPTFDLATLPGRHRVPDTLWDYGNPSDLAWPTDGMGGLECASGDADALALAAARRPDQAPPKEVDSTSERWLDVRVGVSSDGASALRFPRCDVFRSVSDLGHLVPGDETLTLDPAWEVSSLPGSRVGFLDVTRTAEVFRYSGSGGADDSVLLAIGTFAGAGVFELRTCRVGRHGTEAGPGVWEHRVLETDWSMDAESGRAVATVAVARMVSCAESIDAP
jgi:hypothetical protein